MAKSKKKKNFRLRRRVKRTIAALTMVMAIVVAAIPVENYGSMRAAEDELSVRSVDTDFNMEAKYKEDKDKEYWKAIYDDKKKGTYENGYTKDEYIIQQVNGTSVEDVYKVKVNNNKAIISSGIASNIKANSKEYYGYVMFKANDLSSKLGGAFFLNDVSELRIPFDEDTTEVELAGGSYTTDGGVTTAVLDPICISSSENYFKLKTELKNSKISLDTLDGEWAKNYVEPSEPDPTIIWNTLLGQCENAVLTDAQNRVVDYNNILEELQDIQKELNDANPAQLTNEQIQTWNRYQGVGIEQAYSNAKELVLSKNNLSLTNNLESIYVYILNNYYSKSSSLKDYNFIRGNYDGTSVFLAQHKTVKNDEIHDSNGYLASGSYTIVGVESNAFDNSNGGKPPIISISLPNSITFIGADAFNGCTSLTTAEIDVSNCEIIGDNAFNGSGLSTITFTGNQPRLQTLGVKAFANTPLSGNAEGITIPYSVTEIGDGCFEKTDVKGVTFAAGGSKDVKIGVYAFFDCKELAKVTFADQNKKYEIKRGAFAGGERCKSGSALRDFAFPEGNAQIRYENEDDHNYILAGRSDLSSVTFGKGLNDTIPKDTLRGCFNLNEAHFNSPWTKYDTYVNGEVVKPQQLFSDVTNESFMAYGPQTKTDNQEIADPLKCSWNGFLGYMIEGKDAPVPYCYTDASGNKHIELGYDSGQYIARIDVKEDSDEAVLSNYKLNPMMPIRDTRTEITIPAKIGNYRIVEIGDNCFEGSVKERVYKITIEDGHLVSIGEGAFRGCSNLEWVFIGNSVKSIGANAFSDCTALENVEFSTTGKIDYKSGQIDYLIGDEDETWANEISIDDSAFNTQSERLTFHGAIHSGYRPFEIAMSANNSNLLKSNRQVCYKTDEPLNLTVIRNRHGGKATLVDYPHYQEIDDINREYIRQNHEGVGDSYSITDEFERNCVNSDTGMESATERAIVEAALNIELPRGIESISTHDDQNTNTKDGFFDKQSGNEDDYSYIKQHYVWNRDNVKEDVPSNFASKRIYELKDIETGIRSGAGDKKDIAKLYSEDGLIEDTQYAADYALPKDEKVARGGLFSGYFNDNNKEVSSRMVEQYALNADGSSSGLIDNTYNGHSYIENYNSGNDYLTSIKMATVDSLPDYVFDNCENLLRASLSENLETIGALPFRGCKNVYDVNLGAGNQNFLVQNMMLFAANGDGKTYTLKECLEGRGKGNVYGSAVIGADEFPEGVTEIEERAFANCDELSTADLSNTSVINIPVDCFKNSKKLQNVTLPNTIRRIETGAFVGVGAALSITVPTSDCVFTADAIDGKSDITIIGSKYKTDGETLSDLYHSYETLVKSYGEDKVHFTDYGNSYRIDFVDRDLQTIAGYSYVVEIKEEEKPYNLNAQQIPPSAPEVDGYDFVTWMCRVNGEVLTGTKAGDRAFNNINEDRLYYPSYEANPKKVVSDGNLYRFNFANATATLVSGSATIADGTTLKSGDSIEGGATINLVASDQSKFQYWSAANGDTSYNDMFAGNINNYIITFTMPNSDVTVTAHLKDGSSGNNPGGNNPGGNNPGGNNPGGNNPGGNKPGEDGKKYKVTVNYGSGSGEYAAGATVNISAYAPDSPNRVFSKWTTSNSGLSFVNANAATTSFVMPAADVTVTANYKVRTNDDDDDDDDRPSKRPGTNTSTTTVPNRPGSSSTGTTGTTGTVTNPASGSSNAGNTGSTANNNGNKIYITKNGVSNKDVASISVDGSTDNFIVRITESAEATAAVEEALINKYGSLDGLVYFPMDISLYDSTGQNKITDTYGLNITVTMPIPDVLIQYGGNSRVAAADNGNLQQLTPRFTTIDGIACISFVPPHFSPYVIYVDTSNLTAGQTLDSTPSTGDPIHPKWFAAIGMACISILLFVTSDGRKRKNYKAA